MYEVPVYQVRLVRDSTIPYPTEQIRNADDAVYILRKHLDGVDREHFVVMMLDTKHQVIGINTVSVGSLDGTLMHPREVFKPAILSNANAILLAHNHPSGMPEPSLEDIKLTKRMVEAGGLLGIDVLDHIIIGDGTSRWHSLKAAGQMNL